MKTDVAIIVGCYKQEQYMPQALYSAENQIVPDICTGNLPSLQVYPSYDTKGIGASAHRNRAIAAVDADWIIWLDADDLIPSDYVYAMDTFRLLNRGRKEFYFAPMQFIAGCRLDKILSIPLKDFILPFGMSAMFPKKGWECVGGFDENLFNMNDLDFWLRLAEAGYLPMFVPSTQMFKRDVPGSLLKAGDSKADEILAQFNTKHNLNLKSKILPYLVPRTEIL